MTSSTSDTGTLRSANLGWGFYGTISGHHDADAAWGVAMNAVAEATVSDLQASRLFLDSRHGRHFADAVLDKLAIGQPIDDAVKSVVDIWMTWSIDRRTEREWGIPRGLPYLTGIVGHLEIEASFE